MSDLFDKYTNSDVGSEIENIAKSTQETKISVDHFTEDEKKIIRSMATSHEQTYESVVQKFNDFVEEPYFSKMQNTVQRFKMIKRLVENKLETMVKLAKIDLFLIGKTINYIEKLKHTMTIAVILTMNEITGEMELKTLSAYEPLGDKAFETILNAKNGFYYQALIAQSDKGYLSLKENSAFLDEMHPAEIDDTYDNMSDIDIISQLTKKEIFSSVADAGMSDKTEKGYPKPLDFKIVHVILEKPRIQWKSKAQPSVYKLKFSGTDMEGSKIVVSLNANQEFKDLENSTSSFIPGYAICTISEYNSIPQLDAFHFVREEEE